MQTTKPIMVVEDERDIRDNMVMLLEDEGYDVYCASNGREALALLHDAQRPLPGLIALDLYMPVMDGQAFLDALAAKEEAKTVSATSVVLVTASDAQARANLHGEVVDVLKKPVDIDKLLALVAQYCGTP